MKTSHSRSNRRQAKARALPHWPAPVSVVSLRTSAWALANAWGTAVLGLWEPAGETPSYL
jgi:hypothetical protein